MEIDLKKHPVTDVWNYESYGSSTYYVYEVQKDDEIDTLSLGMLTRNDILGLAPTMFSQVDDRKYIKFNVSSKVVVSQVFSGIVNKKRFSGVLLGIVNSLLSADDYMLDPRSVMIDMDKMFMDISSGETNLICLPIICDSKENIDYAQFFRKMLFTTQFDQTENCDYVTKLINFFNSSSTLSLDGLRTLLNDLRSDESNNIAMSAAMSSPMRSTGDPGTQVVTPRNVRNNRTENRSSSAQTKTPSIFSNTVVTESQKSGKIEPGAVQPQVSVPVSNGAVKGNETVKNDVLKTPAQGVGFKIPAQQTKINLPSAGPDNTKAADANENEISFLYLMQHYNKENAAAYKAQKEARKKKQQGEAGMGTVNNQQSFSPPPRADKSVPFKTPTSVNAPSAPVNPVNNQIGDNHINTGTMSAPAMNKAVPPPPPIGGFAAEMKAPVQQEIKQHNTSSPSNMVSGGFGETTVLSPAVTGETTVLNASSGQVSKRAFIIRVRTQEKIPINSDLFRIGKERSFVNYFISDNTAISRSHANILTKNGKYYVVDTNSTNHTYVNGEMITSNSEVEISEGSRIKLANEEFVFKLE